MRKVPAQIDPLQRKYDGELHEIVVAYQLNRVSINVLPPRLNWQIEMR